MELNVYRSIVSTIQNYTGSSSDCMLHLKSEFPKIEHHTLYSILASEYCRRMKILHVKNSLTQDKYWELYQQAIGRKEKPGIILRISKKLNLCPCLVAKLILQKYFDNNHGEERVEIGRYMRDTTLIPDASLSYEVLLCTIYDNLYSPFSESIKHSLGQEYEIHLHNQVVKLNLAFRDEDHLRKYGYDKTPDVKLDVPVIIDGFVINWIESKALFGDEETHKEYTRNQYLSYWNRFGSGLVIYWFGYVKTICGEDARFMVRDHLPSNIVHIKYLNLNKDTDS